MSAELCGTDREDGQMTDTLDALLDFVQSHSRMVVITGAGISAQSGIPTYRNDAGEWQRSRPIQHQEFIRSDAYRRRYWARSAVGWPPVANAKPNRAHFALAALESIGIISLLVTQNVDRLHQCAGHQQVIDLHGRLDRVVCLDCGHTDSRAAVQDRLLEKNPFLTSVYGAPAPDGDADIEESIVECLESPRCTQCNGIPMPDVVFYGGSVPRKRIEIIRNTIEQADALLTVGTTLSVYSAFQFCRQASQLGLPIAAINRGKTRADDLLTLKVSEDCGEALEWLTSRYYRGRYA